MRLHPQERIWWAPDLTLTTLDGQIIPDVVFEASFDNGKTWVARLNGRWLIAGKDYPGVGDGPDGVNSDAIISCTTQVLIRARDHPETVIDSSLRITVLV